jgi:peroxiredoxin
MAGWGDIFRSTMADVPRISAVIRPWCSILAMVREIANNTADHTRADMMESSAPQGAADGIRDGAGADAETILMPGAMAPDFALNSTPDQKLSLRELRGQPVVLAFYPADWSPVCGDELALFNEILPELHKFGAQLIGISVDGVWCHAEFARVRKLHFPLLADFEPKGAVARLYGSYREHDGFAQRALFVIDGDGIIRWSYCSPVGVNPGADGVLSALESLPEAGGGRNASPSSAQRASATAGADS